MTAQRASERVQRAAKGGGNWSHNRKRVDYSNIKRWMRMVSWRRAI